MLYRFRKFVCAKQFTPLIAIALFIGHANGQCYVDAYTGQRYCTGSSGNCPSCNICPSCLPCGSSRQVVAQSPLARPNSVNVDSTAHCRITVNNTTLGSGTLVARDQSIGLVLTCAHLFDESPQKIVVAFPGGGQFAAKVVEVDHDQDLAALAIRRPDVEPLPVASGDPSGALVACGFGPNGTFRGIQGNITGIATAVGAAYASTTIAGAVRPGDSGGGVLNVSGQVVGVVWGQRDGLTYATCGRPVCDFLIRARDKVFAKVTVANKPVSTAPAASPNPPATPQLDLKAFANELDSRMRDLDAKKQDRGDYLLHGDLNGYLRTEDAVKLTGPLAIKSDVENKISELASQFGSVHTVVDSVKQHVEQIAADKDGILQGVSYGKIAVAALGLSGPLAAAVLAAAGFVGLRLKSRHSQSATLPVTSQNSTVSPKAKSRPIAVDSPPPPQQTVPETHYVPVEQDSFAKAHQWASEHVARKYPGATEVLQTQDSLIKQFLASKSGSK
jgi:hypothetical protein